MAGEASWVLRVGGIASGCGGAVPENSVWGHCPGLRCGDGGRGPCGTIAGVLSYLGRVLRCFEWFRDLVDPWWMRRDDAPSLWGLPSTVGSPLQSSKNFCSQKKPRCLRPELPASAPPASSITLPGALCASQELCFSARAKWERKREGLGQGRGSVWAWGWWR